MSGHLLQPVDTYWRSCVCIPHKAFDIWPRTQTKISLIAPIGWELSSQPGDNDWANYKFKTKPNPNKLTRDLAPKANVLRCHHHHCHTPQWGRGGTFHGEVAHFMRGGTSLGGVWLWSLLGWWSAEGGWHPWGGIARSHQAWTTVCSNTTLAPFFKSRKVTRDRGQWLG